MVMSERKYKLLEPPLLKALRKEAKELIDGFRANDADTVSRVHKVEELKKLEHDKIKLKHAYNVLALENGFDTWIDFKFTIER